QLFGTGANPELRAERATHALAGVEQALGGSVRVRLEAYDERRGDFIADPDADWKRVGPRIVGPDSGAPLRNHLTGRSRRIAAPVERGSARPLSGWISYTLGHARWREGDGPAFDGDYDQRHTVTLFGAWRIGHAAELSTKYRYGSGFPVPGYY